MLVVMAQEEKMKEYINFLQKVNIFETLSPGEISRLAEVIQEEDFDEDEAIIEQGEVLIPSVNATSVKWLRVIVAPDHHDIPIIKCKMRDDASVAL